MLKAFIASQSLRQRPAVCLGLAYFGFCLILRLILLGLSASTVSWGWSTLTAFLTGALFDGFMASIFALPLTWLGAALPLRRSATRPSLLLLTFLFLGLWLLAFFKVSELLFWNEFTVRFNFIAVDYLVYTTEVVANIHQSYPMPLILGGITLFVVAVFYFFRRYGLIAPVLPAQGFLGGRWVWPLTLSLVFLAGLASAGWVGGREGREQNLESTPLESVVARLRHMGQLQPDWSNSVDTELGKNGEYAFLAAFWSNTLPWNQFYLTADNPVDDLRRELKADGVPIPSKGIRCQYDSQAKPKLNVIQITVESLSAKYVGAFGIKDAEEGIDYGQLNLTPHLDRLAQESLWFDACYASGTRTVRGMEALTLSIPPIPGQSVLRRENCEHLGTLGSVFQQNGYDTAFIYGGDGFFDNMSYFFANNGYRVVDRPTQAARGILPSFANAWGACDDDAFAWSMAEADRAYAEGKPFHHFIMTTSNHRPYTWPEGRIRKDLVGRHGGVAYSDAAIGAFIEAARSRPWFRDTLFVIVADHGASVAGKRELEVAKYHIPFLIWSPAHVPARRIPHLVAQMDVATTLLALMDLPRRTTFLGADALAPDYRPRAFISNYQKVGLVREGVLTVLKPVRQSAQYQVDLSSGSLTPLLVARPDLIEATRAYYQGADYLHSHGQLQLDAPR